MDASQAGRTQAALRDVDDALEGEVVVRLHDQTEVGDGVPNFLPLVEASAADDAVGQADGDQPLLELAGLKAGAHQHRHAAQRLPFAAQPLHLVANHPRLVLAVPDAAYVHLLAAVALGPQRLAEPAAIVGDQPGGGCENVRRRTVVALQPDHPRARKIALEAQDVADLGAAPGIDRLVVVADAAEIAMPLRQCPKPQILRDVGILVLVDEHIAELPLILRRDFRVLAKDREPVQQQVAEIDGVQRLEPLLVLAVERQRQAVDGFGALRLGDAIRDEASILPALDHRHHEPGRRLLGVDVARFLELLDQPDLVVRIEDGEIRLEADELGVATQHAGGGCMEGPDPPALDRTAEQARYPLAHLSRRLVGEGDGQHLPRPRLAGGEDVREPGGEHPRLAGPGAGQHQHRPLGRLDRLRLSGVQTSHVRRRGYRLERRVKGVCHLGHEPHIAVFDAASSIERVLTVRR